MTKTLLITGAYGLVGSNICKVLERDYPDIQITKVKFDDCSFLGKHQFDYVIHAAGYGQPAKFSDKKLLTIWMNTSYTNTLLDYFMKPEGKFLFVSSSEVYSGAPSPHKETDIGTTTPQHPRACYIEGKRCGEAICMAYKEQGYNVKIARLALAYGPGTKKGDTRVLNQFIEQALTTGEIKMKDDGSAIRTYIYVEDAAKIIINLLIEPLANSTVYNIGGLSRLSIFELACIIGELTGAKVIRGHIGYDPSPEEVRLDMSKTLRDTLYGNLVSFIDGIKETIEYQKELYAR